MLSLRLFQRFADYRYFREIAEFMKVKIPLVNHQILLENNRQCLVHGIKMILPEHQLTENMQTEVGEQKHQPLSQFKVQHEGHAGQEPSTQITYIFDKHSEITLTFSNAILISKNLGLDLCLIRNATETNDPVLSVSSVRKQIYSQYYNDFVKRKRKNEHKTIRLSDRINQNDLNYKYNNLKRMHQHGQRHFKIETNNDSQKSETIIKEFCEMFGKKVEPRLKTFKIPPRNKTEERWICHLHFDEQVQIDPKKVNKKWKNYKYELEDAEKRDKQQNKQDFDVDTVEMERQMYHAYKQMGLKMPKKFQEIADLEEAMKTDKFALYRVEQKEEDDLDWDDEQERKFQEKQAKFNREYFGERTVEQILTEMEELKKSGYESEAYKVARFKQLRAELDLKVKKPNKDL